MTQQTSWLLVPVILMSFASPGLAEQKQSESNVIESNVIESNVIESNVIESNVIESNVIGGSPATEARLGIGVTHLPEVLTSHLPEVIDDGRGVLVSKVVEGSASEQAGLRRHDNVFRVEQYYLTGLHANLSRSLTTDWHRAGCLGRALSPR